jgi:type II secretory pathway pseudopilin PulG
MKIPKRKSFFKFSSGFTLAELLIYIGIVGAVSGMLVGILSTVTKTQVQESSQNEISGQLNFALSTIQRLVRDSSLIEVDAGVSTSTLKLRMPNLEKDPTLVYLSNGQIYVKQGNGQAASITSNNVNVDSLEFKKVSQPPAKDVVQVNISISQTQQSGKTISRTIRSAIGRVNAAVFDSDLIPNADDSYNIGTSPIARWKTASFSGGVTMATVSGNVGIGTASPFSGSKLGVVGGLIYVGDTNTRFGAQISGDDAGRALFGSNLYLTGNNTLATFGTHTNYGYSGIEAYWGSLKFYTASGSTTQDAVVSPTPTMIITNTGNVGIGITPTEKIEVLGGNIKITRQSGDTLSASLILDQQNQGNQGKWVIASRNTPNLGIYNASLGKDVMTFLPSGSVGIGTSTPTTAGLVVGNNVSGASIDAGNNRIINVATPTQNNDAANKAYVDAAAGGGYLNVYKSDGVTLLGRYLGTFYNGEHYEGQSLNLVLGGKETYYGNYYPISYSYPNQAPLYYIQELDNLCDLTIYLDQNTGKPKHFRTLECDNTLNGRWYFITTNCTGNAYFKYDESSYKWVTWVRDGSTFVYYLFSRNGSYVYEGMFSNIGTYNTMYSYRETNGTCINATTTGLFYPNRSYLFYGNSEVYYTSVCGTGSCVIKP